MKIKLTAILDLFFILKGIQAQERIQLLPGEKIWSGTITDDHKWLASNRKIFKGGKIYKIDVPVDRIPYFEKMNKSK